MGHQIKNNCAAKSTIKKVKTQPTKWKKILQIIINDHYHYQSTGQIRDF